ncbi:Ppx/GppA phosphatase family protein [Corynebacterium kutscheri]|uniref:Ppx/GppA phosphatase family n=1 Tax=Corynebacterium kutscheri TaxID=35755 RepID=A0A0F6TE84_9CORY|nr:Ppx/GppA phosphatase family protein [Corynebacterium kutscheri]AKE41789.1 Ppx/GppA phosphatase family [Corynebacterium kutscheri]VEH09064.1 Ppx/GppA phosphatase family protein [Corynebacterium kutscheri]VEH10115.1 Ppx/GppA phosphatase family protein [Corynebacterium kutscheri]VEH80197.1 Ppx/GppA phosphatase family protein [Corynebacterium kutscheri]
MPRFAAIDCGTNSIRLLISDVDITHLDSFTDVIRIMEIIRLGQGVDATGELNPAAIERARQALEKFVSLMKRENVVDVRMVATSATRDARNKDEFFEMTKCLLGQIKPGAQAEVISGEQEARLSFQGAVADLPVDKAPLCVIDLGGGSTEFIVGKQASIVGSHSAQMGCVRLSERIMHSDPATPTEIASARSYIDERLAEVLGTVPINQAQTFVGCAGTFTTLAALALGLEEYDPQQIHNSILHFDALRVLTQQLIAETAQQRAGHPVVHPGRADVLASGCLVVEQIMDLIETETGVNQIRVSEKDILDGIIIDLVSTHIS